MLPRRSGLLPNLLEEEAVFVRKVRPESLVEDLNDLGQWHFLVLRLARANVCRAFHALGFTFIERDLAGVILSLDSPPYLPMNRDALVDRRLDRASVIERR